MPEQPKIEETPARWLRFVNIHNDLPNWIRFDRIDWWELLDDSTLHLGVNGQILEVKPLPDFLALFQIPTVQ